MDKYFKIENCKLINVTAEGKKQKELVIPDTVISIGNYAFWYCESLTSVIIPEGVTSIGELAFAGCSNLTNVSIPSTVTYIPNSSVFKDTPWLAAKQAENPLVVVNNILIDGTTAYTGDTVVIPDNINTIADYAFYDCTNLTSVTIPDSVKSIGSGAFNHCTGLTSVVIPDSVTSIGSYAFFNCTNLTSVTIPNSVTKIGEWTFYGCESLISVTIPNSVTEIGDYAFNKCSSLCCIVLYNTLHKIGIGIFDNCNNITINYAGTIDEWNEFKRCNMHGEWFNRVVIPYKDISMTYEESSDISDKNIITLTKTFEARSVEDIDDMTNNWIKEMHKDRKTTGFNVINITSYPTEDFHAKSIVYTINDE